MKIQTILSVLLVLSLLTGLGLAGELPRDLPTELPTELPEHILDLHRATRTVSGEFVQEKRLAMFEQTLISRGYFAVEQPGKIHWAYHQPSESGFASDGVRIRRWNEHSGMSPAAPLSRDPLMSVIVDQMMAWSTMDTQALERFFSITVMDTDPISLHLEPKAAQLREILHQVRISFNSEESHIQEIMIFEEDGDTTRIRFEHVRINQELAPDLF